MVGHAARMIKVRNTHRILVSIDLTEVWRTGLDERTILKWILKI
jgi:hypothetical protein